MKFKIEFELEDVNINDPLVTEEYILECLIESLKHVLGWDNNDELFVDIDDEKYNVYEIKVIG